MVIEVDNWVKSYGTFRAVDGVDLSIKEGELFALLGHNGAGKTTLISMLSTRIRPTSGRATVLGYDVATQGHLIRQNIGVSPQESAVAPRLSVRENIELIGRIYGIPPAQLQARSDALIALMGLEESSTTQAQKLSGGMARKLSLIMALISEPKVLFLDEPTLGLDPQARRELWDYIAKLKGKTTILLTTHYLEEAQALADTIAILRHGKIVAQGTADALLKHLETHVTLELETLEVAPLELVTALQSLDIEVIQKERRITLGAKELDVQKVVDVCREKAQRITWLSMHKNASLEEVYLQYTKEQ
ncbi:MAG: hypothetical protein KU37_03885 [Sulfuricurvum sp. PC08-66]|nr:MAG: hypothetical protein KU37_03885 [Sulfuricurvum sp. PC08-66]